MDDRVGCAVVIEAMKRLAHTPHPNQISGWRRCRKRLACAGAHLQHIVKPEIGIAIEGGVTRDAPKWGRKKRRVAGRRASTFSVRFKRAAQPEICGAAEADGKGKIHSATRLT